MRGFFPLLCALFAAGVVGCANPPRVAVTPVPTVQEYSLSQVKKALETREHRFLDMKAIARLTISTPEGRKAMRQILLLKRGPNLRLEILGFFGRPAAYFTSNRDGIRIYYPDRGEYFIGGPSSRHLKDFLGIDMDVADLVMLLTGNPLSKQGWTEETLSYLPQKKAYLLSRFASGGDFSERLVWLDARELTPLAIKFYRRDPLPVLHVEFGKYEEVDGYMLPTEITISMPEKGVEIDLRYVTMEVNSGIPETAFSIAPPQGVKIIDLDKEAF